MLAAGTLLVPALGSSPLKTTCRNIDYQTALDCLRNDLSKYSQKQVLVASRLWLAIAVVVTLLSGESLFE